MLRIAHRINTIEELAKVPVDCGVEIDVHASAGGLILHHDPNKGGEELGAYLSEYRHSFIIFNIKEAGIEDLVVDLAKKYDVQNYFLLDVEYPYIYRATRELGFSKIAIRYSEAEPIELALAHKGLVDWVWIDTNTKLPLDANIANQLKGFKLALVGPDRWGRPEDILTYSKRLKAANVHLDAVMTDRKYLDQWKELM